MTIETYCRLDGETGVENFLIPCSRKVTMNKKIAKLGKLFDIKQFDDKQIACYRCQDFYQGSSCLDYLDLKVLK